MTESNRMEIESIWWNFILNSIIIVSASAHHHQPRRHSMFQITGNVNYVNIEWIDCFLRRHLRLLVSYFIISQFVFILASTLVRCLTLWPVKHIIRFDSQSHTHTQTQLISIFRDAPLKLICVVVLLLRLLPLFHSSSFHLLLFRRILCAHCEMIFIRNQSEWLHYKS